MGQCLVPSGSIIWNDCVHSLYLPENILTLAWVPDSGPNYSPLRSAKRWIFSLEYCSAKWVNAVRFMCIAVCDNDNWTIGEEWHNKKMRTNKVYVMIRNEASNECPIDLSQYLSQLSWVTRTKISQAAHLNIHPYQQTSDSTFDSRYGSAVIASTHFQAPNVTQNIQCSKSAWTWHKGAIQTCTVSKPW